MPDIDQHALEAATNALVDLYLDRRDIQFTAADGATLDAARFLGWALTTDDPSADRLIPYRPLIESAVDRLYEEPRRVATLAIRPALTTPGVDEQELEAATDVLVDLYLHRPDLQFNRKDGITLDAGRLLDWALTTDDPSVDRLSPYRPLIESAVARLYEEPRRVATLAIRPALTTPGVDEQELEAATDVLVDLYLHRPDIQFTHEDGTTLDAGRLLYWALTTDDPSADRLIPYRPLIGSGVARLYEEPRRMATLAIRPALTTADVDEQELEAATDVLVDLYLHRLTFSSPTKTAPSTRPLRGVGSIHQ